MEILFDYTSTIHPLKQTIWGTVWKHTLEKSASVINLLQSYCNQCIAMWQYIHSDKEAFENAHWRKVEMRRGRECYKSAPRPAPPFLLLLAGSLYFPLIYSCRHMWLLIFCELQVVQHCWIQSNLLLSTLPWFINISDKDTFHHSWISMRIWLM